MSTLALKSAFPGAEAVIGVDTSKEMIFMANILNTVNSIIPIFDPIMAQLSIIMILLKEQGNKVKHNAARAKKSVVETAGDSLFAKYLCGNAEKTDLPSRSFDLVTVMYAFHEAPQAGREKILREARRLLRPGGTLAGKL